MNLNEITEMRDNAPDIGLISTDPTAKRTFKKVPVVDEQGRVVDYKVGRYNPTVLPNKTDVEQCVNYDMTDLSVQAHLNRLQESVNLETSPNVDAMEVATFCKDVKSKI